MAYTIAFFGSKPYDEASFNEKNSEYGFELRYYKGHLNLNNVILTQGVDAVCIFVNDTADAEVIRQMAANGVKLLALRCAGYNNVDLKAAAENGITVVRVPAYSPYAVAEYTVALMLSLNRKIPRATWRTRDGNFSLHGLLGFDMYGKTAGIIGTGKIAKKLITILRGFGMNILAYDLYPDYNFAREEKGRREPRQGGGETDRHRRRFLQGVPRKDGHRRLYAHLQFARSETVRARTFRLRGKGDRNAQRHSFRGDRIRNARKPTPCTRHRHRAWDFLPDRRFAGAVGIFPESSSHRLLIFRPEPLKAARGFFYKIFCKNFVDLLY